jgi:hypothetical protein
MKLYCFYDTVAEEGGMIFEARNDHVARRIFSTMEDSSFPPGSSKNDFRIFRLGYYDKSSVGKFPTIKGHEKPYDITNALEVEDEAL